MRARITGLGIVSPLGVGGEAPDRPPGIFAGDFDAEAHADPRTLRKVSELTRMATVAAAVCLERAGFPDDPALRDETAVVLGNCFGSARYHLEYHEALRRGGPAAASALLFTESVFNAASSHIGQVQRLRGANLTLVGGEPVGLQAIALAADRIRLGACPAALAGGAEQHAALTEASLRAQGRIESPSEGAALLLLEAPGRDSPVLARVLGSGSSRGDGAVRRALADAGLEAGAIDRWVSTPLGDGFAFSSAARVAIGALAVARGKARHVLVCERTRSGSAMAALVLGPA